MKANDDDLPEALKPINIKLFGSKESKYICLTALFLSFAMPIAAFLAGIEKS